MGILSRWFGGRRPVQVTFVDADEGAVFARSELAPQDLPETFELDTVMHLGDDAWQVVDARPKLRSEYSRTGELRLTLRRVVSLDPGELRYSVPTISNEQAPLEAEVPGPVAPLRLAGDDWRQVEFVDAALAGAVDEELAAVRAVLWANEGSAGFNAIHVRRSVPEPLTAPLSRSEVLERLAVGDVCDVVTESIEGAVGRVAGGFAFRASGGAEVYGLGEERVTVLAVAELQGNFAPLLEFARERGLVLVNWCAGERSGN